MQDKYRMLTKIVRNMKLKKNKEQKVFNDNESEALRYVTKHPGCNANNITDYLNVDKGLVTRIISKLVKEECIIIKLQEDKRKKYLYPTTKALEMKLDQQNFEHQYYESLFQDISIEQQNIFFSVLEKIYFESKSRRIKENEKKI